MALKPFPKFRGCYAKMDFCQKDLEGRPSRDHKCDICGLQDACKRLSRAPRKRVV